MPDKERVLGVCADGRDHVAAAGQCDRAHSVLHLALAHDCAQRRRRACACAVRSITRQSGASHTCEQSAAAAGVRVAPDAQHRALSSPALGLSRGDFVAAIAPRQRCQRRVMPAEEALRVA